MRGRATDAEFAASRVRGWANEITADYHACAEGGTVLIDEVL